MQSILVQMRACVGERVCLLSVSPILVAFMYVLCVFGMGLYACAFYPWASCSWLGVGDARLGVLGLGWHVIFCLEVCCVFTPAI